jgi:hypothetical protein
MADGTLKVGTITNSAGSGNIAIGSGVTLLSNVPAFEAYLSVSQNPSDATYTKQQCNVERLDTDNAYDTSNYRFTPQVAGKYFVYANTIAACVSANQVLRANVAIYKNGAVVLQNRFNSNSGTLVENGFVFCSGVIELNGSTDYVESFAYIDVGAGTPVIFGGANESAYFGAYRIGA